MARKWRRAATGGLLLAVLVCWLLPASVGVGAFLILVAWITVLFVIFQTRQPADPEQGWAYADEGDD